MGTKQIRLSSNLTFAYKYIIPTIFFLGFTFCIVSVFIDYLNIELGGRITLSFFTLIFSLLMIPLVQLQFIYFDNEYTIIEGKRQRHSIPNKNIVKVKRFIFYFYRLHYKKNGKIKKAIFLPQIPDVLICIWCKPKSIKKYESKITNSTIPLKQ